MMIFIQADYLVKGVRLYFFGWLVKKAPLLLSRRFFYLMKAKSASNNSDENSLSGSL